MENSENCSAFKEKLSALLDGELTAREQEAVRKHLAECPACSAELEQMERTRELMSRVDPAMPSEERWGEAWKKISIWLDEKPASASWRRFFPLAIAAAVLIAVALIFAFPGRKPAVSVDEPESVIEIEDVAEGYSASIDWSESGPNTIEIICNEEEGS